MSFITLVRHGQANTAARDENSYDRLSDLGHQQARWLGAHLKDTQAHHPRVYCGTLTRHVETAASMGLAEPVHDARLNEIEYFTLAQLFHEQHGVAIPIDREEFVEHLPKTFTAWANGEIENPPETFVEFETRVRDALRDIGTEGGPAIVVTSGGLISMVVRQAMMLDITSMARVALAIMNTSMHRLHPIGSQLSPVLFNAVPHLEAPDRHFAQTHL
ncbi:histidine phosphatase family protein [Ruegeria conchae]|uniref:Broad specificity phosphatase PhoE n=1 Tax=Ruegeria conchae TaxID=981384 RepID=A0A497YYP7_9RHOB|nr:histidine phosphatase family protein [Ruegeria conchae]RLJ99802.1 broad specificity phosphatase PhoE [Ruegeria conchae]UWR02594.1 histidine phosphatase family protein [Ruegeria conchae]